MAVIEREYKPELITLRIRLEQSLAQRLEKYCEYMDSSADHIISQALEYVMDHDKDFRQATDGVKLINKRRRASAAD